MHFARPWSVLCAAAALVACSGSGDSGRMAIRLVDAPADVKQLELDIQKVEINGPDGWRTLSEPKEIVDVMALKLGVSHTLADQTLPAGTYGQLRLVLGPRNTVVLDDGSVHDLKVPSGQQSGVKLVTHFVVAPGTTKDVYIDFLAARSIFVHEAGASEQYLLRPTVRAYDKLETGAITGRLVDAATQAPLAGVEVMAEVVDGTGTPSVVRAVPTDVNGHYVLDLLPVDGTYHVVAQPRVGATAYAARASGPIPITAAAPTPTWDAAFDVAAQVGALTGTITPAATIDEDDTVLARQPLAEGGATTLLVVRAAPASVSAGVESYGMQALPAGAYSVVAIRRTIDAAGDATERPSAAATATVTSGATATASLSFP